MKRNVNNLFELLYSNVLEFKREVDNNYYSVPIFSYYDMSILLEKLKILSNGELTRFRNFIKDIYTNVSTEINTDYANLILLKNKIDNYILDKPNTLKFSIMREFSKTLIETCSRNI